MPFSSLVDPAHVARAHAATRRAWAEIEPELPATAHAEAEKLRLAYIVAGLAPGASDEDELLRLALERFNRDGSGR